MQALTFTLCRSPSPAVVILAHAAGRPRPLIPSVAVVLTHRPVVIGVRGAGQVAMQGVL